MLYGLYDVLGSVGSAWPDVGGTTPDEPPGSPEDGYHLTEDLADRAIAWVRQQKSLLPDTPSFVCC